MSKQITGNIDDNTGDELALHCRRVHPAGDRHRHDMRGNLLQNCRGDFFLLFLFGWVWTLFLPQVLFFAGAEPGFSLRGKSNLKSKRLKITSFELQSCSVISRYDVAAVREEAFHSPSFLNLIQSKAVNFLTRTKIVQLKSKTGIKGLDVNIQEDCPFRVKIGIKSQLLTPKKIARFKAIMIGIKSCQQSKLNRNVKFKAIFGMTIVSNSAINPFIFLLFNSRSPIVIYSKCQIFNSI